VNNYHPGDRATLTYIRDGKEVTVSVVFQAADAASSASNSGAVDAQGLTSFYGGKIRSASAETLRKFGLSSGVEVVDAGNGELAQSGVKSGFIIQYVNDQLVSTPAQVVEQARKATSGVYLHGVDAKGKVRYYAFGK
jgi:S1-C subfamily serine protease